MRKVKKLVLHKETLRTLGSEGLRGVQGGVEPYTQACTASVGCLTDLQCWSWLNPCEAD